MQLLFIHQNCPGQFRHLIFDLLKSPEHEVWAMGEGKRVSANWRTVPTGLRLMGYAFDEKAGFIPDGPVRTTERNINRGLAVAASLTRFKAKGLNPDVIFGHPGWGEMLFVRDVFPNARIVNYCEFYFNFEGQDHGFDKEFDDGTVTPYGVRAQNMTMSQSMLSADLGISPTHWQRSRYPDLFQSKIEVIFDGVDCDIVKPAEQAELRLASGAVFRKGRDQVITFVNRNLEPMRGFHVFMRALPEMLKRHPEAQVVIVGGDEPSYSRPLRGTTYRQHMIAELGDTVDWTRVHFAGRISYADYLSLLQVSSAHVYLTYPFVLSWSLMEALAASCVVIGSKTAPVQEVITNGENGLLVDFFDTQEINVAVSTALTATERISDLRRNAREFMLKHYDLKKICLPNLKSFLLHS